MAEEKHVGLSLAETLRIAWKAIAANPLRSALTALGVIIGVAAVVALTMVGQGRRETSPSSWRASGQTSSPWGRPRGAGAREAAWCGQGVPRPSPLRRLRHPGGLRRGGGGRGPGGPGAVPDPQWEHELPGHGGGHLAGLRQGAERRAREGELLHLGRRDRQTAGRRPRLRRRRGPLRNRRPPGAADPDQRDPVHRHRRPPGQGGPGLRQHELPGLRAAFHLPATPRQARGRGSQGEHDLPPGRKPRPAQGPAGTAHPLPRRAPRPDRPKRLRLLRREPAGRPGERERHDEDPHPLPRGSRRSASSSEGSGS